MTSTSHKYERSITYPIRKRYTTECTLRNGASVTFRPIEPTDEREYNAFFKSLSKQTLHLRFFEIIKELPPEELRRYCSLDYNQEIAIVAEPQGDSAIVGVGRLVLDRNRRRGEFALTIADDWQGLGLGGELLGYTIKIAQDYGLEGLYCLVSSDNLGMIGLSRKMGFRAKSTDGDTIKMTLSLTGFEESPIA